MERPISTTVALVETNSAPLGVELVSTRMTNKMAEPQDLVDLAQQVQKGDEFIRANAGSRLTQIAEQIRHLQEQARKVLEEAKRNADLHHTACNLVKKPGTVYYLYQRQSGQKYFSILSPQEWGSSCPHQYIAAYRLECDQSWTPLEEITQRDEENAIVDKVLKTQLTLTDSVQTGLKSGLTIQTEKSGNTS